jgi:hypothetical protein
MLKLIELKQLYEVHEKQGFFYFSFFFDFRSRLYYHSLISLTNFKLSRFFFTEDSYSDEDLLKIIDNSVKSQSSKILISFYKDLEDSIKEIAHQDYFNNTYSEFKNCAEYKKSLLVSNLVDLGVINKSKILKKKIETDCCYSISISEFLKEGLSILNLFKKDDSCFDYLKKEDEVVEIVFKQI